MVDDLQVLVGPNRQTQHPMVHHWEPREWRPPYPNGVKLSLWGRLGWSFLTKVCVDQAQPSEAIAANANAGQIWNEYLMCIPNNDMSDGSKSIDQIPTWRFISFDSRVRLRPSQHQWTSGDASIILALNAEQYFSLTLRCCRAVKWIPHYVNQSLR